MAGRGGSRRPMGGGAAERGGRQPLTHVGSGGYDSIVADGRRTTDRRRWHRMAADVGVVVAPAGLNFLVPSTTAWLYDRPAGEEVEGVGAAGFAFRSTGVRVAVEGDDLRRHLAALRIVDALWERRLARVPGRASGVGWPAALRARVGGLALPRRELDLRGLLTRAAAVLEGLRLVPAYHPRGAKSFGYLFDLLENGLTFLLVSAPGRATRPTNTVTARRRARRADATANG